MKLYSEVLSHKYQFHFLRNVDARRPEDHWLGSINDFTGIGLQRLLNDGKIAPEDRVIVLRRVHQLKNNPEQFNRALYPIWVKDEEDETWSVKNMYDLSSTTLIWILTEILVKDSDKKIVRDRIRTMLKYE